MARRAAGAHQSRPRSSDGQRRDALQADRPRAPEPQHRNGGHELVQAITKLTPLRDLDLSETGAAERDVQLLLRGFPAIDEAQLHALAKHATDLASTVPIHTECRRFATHQSVEHRYR